MTTRTGSVIEEEIKKYKQEIQEFKEDVKSFKVQLKEERKKTEKEEKEQKRYIGKSVTEEEVEWDLYHTELGIEYNKKRIKELKEEGALERLIEKEEQQLKWAKEALEISEKEEREKRTKATREKKEKVDTKEESASKQKSKDTTNRFEDIDSSLNRHETKKEFWEKEVENLETRVKRLKEDKKRNKNNGT